MTVCRLLIVFFIAALTVSCASTLPDFRNFKDPRNTPEYKALLASGASIHFSDCPAILFKRGRPRIGEDLLTSLQPNQVDIFQSLYSCLALDASTPSIRFEINGFSEPTECNDNCEELSTRRAELVRTAILKMHFPRDTIICTKGHGEKFLIDSTAEKAYVNRRVEIGMTANDKPDSPDCKI